MSQSGLSHALLLDKKGGAKELSYEELKKYDIKDGILWAHFDYSSNEAIEWISSYSGIDPLAVEALLSEESRPRTTMLENDILLSLRGVNLNPGSNPEDMVSIRLFVSENMIVSTKKRDLLSVKDIVNSLIAKKGPASSSELLITLLDRLTSRMEDTINDIQDSVSEVEELTIESDNMDLRTKISQIRREAIALKRYMFPQRDAISTLYHDKVSWFDDYDKVQIREINDELIRYIEELDSISDKITLVQDEFTNRMSEQMNQRMYVLSIISAIFLPLGFLTGLLGINVGGIPGAEDKSSFAIFTLILFIIGGFQFYLLKKYKWI